MRLRPPIATLTDTLVPYTTLFRSSMGTSAISARFGRFRVSTHLVRRPRYGVTRSTCSIYVPHGPSSLGFRYEGSICGRCSDMVWTLSVEVGTKKHANHFSALSLLCP